MSARELARALSEQTQAAASQQALGVATVQRFSVGYADLFMGGSVITGVRCLNVIVAAGDAVLVGIVRGATSAQYVVLGKLGYTPPPLPDPLVWYRADDAIGTDGDAITSLPSALAGGWTLVPAGDPPMLRLASLGSHAGMQFEYDHDGGALMGFGDAMGVDFSGPHAGTVTFAVGLTAFVVATVSQGLGTFFQIYKNDSSQILGLGHKVFIGQTEAAGAAQFYELFDADYGPVLLHEYQFDQATVAYRRGGVLLTPTATYDAPVSPVPQVYDQESIRVGQGPNDGIVYEIRVYDGILSGTDLTAVRSELNATYGL